MGALPRPTLSPPVKANRHAGSLEDLVRISGKASPHVYADFTG
jgi:hypothetical protein